MDAKSTVQDRCDTGEQEPRPGVEDPGLVLSAITARTLSGSLPSKFPTRHAVELAAGLIDAQPAVSDPHPGGVVRRYRLAVGPGVVRIASTVTGDERDRDQAPRGEVTAWSAKSRLRMVERMCSLDWSPVVEPGRPGWRAAMMTLTLPGDWLAIAPDAETFKRLFRAFLERWRRTFGPWAGVWKLEFQRRGAPHLHLYSAVPTGDITTRTKGGKDRVERFRDWLSRTWYEVVGSGDERHLAAGTGIDWREGIRASDPKRLAVYFLKRATGHNLGIDKEYQHIVPDEWRANGGPGRFWGYRGLASAVEEVELDAVQFVQLRRLARRWSRANGRPLPWLGRSRMTGGAVLLNDAPGWLAQASRWHALHAGTDSEPDERRPAPVPQPTA